jgi:hypothetical protein
MSLPQDCETHLHRTSTLAPDPAFARECSRLFAARLRGPAEAREAVLSALAAGEPYPLAWAAFTAGPSTGLSPACARRLGLLAEVVRAAILVCADAYEGRALPSRLDRARRVLVADTLLTFCYELAADLPEPGGEKVRALLLRVIGTRGFLARLASGPRIEPAVSVGMACDSHGGEDGSGSPPSREQVAGASAFLVGALGQLGASLESETVRTILAIT